MVIDFDSLNCNKRKVLITGGQTRILHPVLDGRPTKSVQGEADKPRGRGWRGGGSPCKSPVTRLDHVGRVGWGVGRSQSTRLPSGTPVSFPADPLPDHTQIVAQGPHWIRLGKEEETDERVHIHPLGPPLVRHQEVPGQVGGRTQERGPNPFPNPNHHEWLAQGQGIQRSGSHHWTLVCSD